MPMPRRRFLAGCGYGLAGRLTVLLEHTPVSAEVGDDRVRTVTVRHLPSGDERALAAPYYLDATELGILLELARVEHASGFESRKDTGEERAPEAAQPEN